MYAECLLCCGLWGVWKGKVAGETPSRPPPVILSSAQSAILCVLRFHVVGDCVARHMRSFIVAIRETITLRMEALAHRCTIECRSCFDVFACEFCCVHFLGGYPFVDDACVFDLARLFLVSFLFRFLARWSCAC